MSKLYAASILFFSFFFLGFLTPFLTLLAFSTGAVRQLGRNQVPQTGVARTISVKDVIAVMKRGPQMARSRLIYRLYERIPYDRLTAA